MKVKTTMLGFSTAKYPKIAARSKIESNANAIGDIPLNNLHSKKFQVQLRNEKYLVQNV